MGDEPNNSTKCSEVADGVARTDSSKTFSMVSSGNRRKKRYTVV
jgi:hypothetical protein